MARFLKFQKKQEYMKIAVECPDCHSSLMDRKHSIKSIPSISLLCRLPREFGWREDIIRLSAYYGDYIKEMPFDVPDGIIGVFFCPRCRHDLTVEQECKVCQAPMIEMQLASGGMLEFCMEAYERNLRNRPATKSFKGKLRFCARSGCPNHMIDFHNPDVSLKTFYKAYAPYLQD